MKLIISAIIIIVLYGTIGAIEASSMTVRDNYAAPAKSIKTPQKKVVYIYTGVRSVLPPKNANVIYQPYLIVVEEKFKGGK
jgi:hypothetical protein